MARLVRWIGGAVVAAALLVGVSAARAASPWRAPPPCAAAPCVDLILVLDTSLSSADPWPMSGDPSVLAAELRAAGALLGALDPRHAAVGIVAFSGDVPRSDSSAPWRNPQGGRFPAWTEAPLTADFRRLRGVLEELGRREPDGSSQVAAGIKQGAIELGWPRRAESNPRSGARAAMVILTDAGPLLPDESPAARSRALKSVRGALKRMSEARIACHLVALGAEAPPLRDELEATGGSLAVVNDAEALTPMLMRLAERLSAP